MENRRGDRNNRYSRSTAVEAPTHRKGEREGEEPECKRNKNRGSKEKEPEQEENRLPIMKRTHTKEKRTVKVCTKEKELHE